MAVQTGKDTYVEGLLGKVATYREQAKQAKERVRVLLEEFQNSPEYLALTKELELATEMEGKFDKEVRLYSVKHPDNLPKEVVIKTFKEAVILEPEKAREWCFDSFKPAMKLDEKIFKSAIKDGLVPLDLGHVVEEKRAQIASNLEKYLPDVKA